MTLAASTSSGGVFLSDSSPSITVGQVATPSFFATAQVTGISASISGDVSLQNSSGTASGGAIVLAAPITLGGATGTLSLAASGPITETSGTISANSLSVSSGGGVTLAQNNTIAKLGSVVVTGIGDFVFQDIGDLDLVADATVSDGSIAIATTGMMTISAAITYAATDKVALSSNVLMEEGGFTVVIAPTVIIDATGLSAGALDGITARTANDAQYLPIGTDLEGVPDITFSGMFAAPDLVLLLAVNGGTVTGSVALGGLGVTGFSNTIDLDGSISGVTTEVAAELGFRAGGAENSDRFNNCAIGSASCIVLPILVPELPQNLNNFDLLTMPQPLDPLDIDRLNTGNEDDL